MANITVRALGVKHVAELMLKHLDQVRAENRVKHIENTQRVYNNLMSVRFSKWLAEKTGKDVNIFLKFFDVMPYTQENLEKWAHEDCDDCYREQYFHCQLLIAMADVAMKKDGQGEMVVNEKDFNNLGIQGQFLKESNEALA